MIIRKGGLGDIGEVKRIFEDMKLSRLCMYKGWMPSPSSRIFSEFSKVNLLPVLLKLSVAVSSPLRNIFTCQLSLHVI